MTFEPNTVCARYVKGIARVGDKEQSTKFASFDCNGQSHVRPEGGTSHMDLNASLLDEAGMGDTLEKQRAWLQK
jgi:hypothetical protein